MVSVFSQLADVLGALDVKHVFGVLGHGNLALVDDLNRRHQTAYISMNREDAAVSASDAYARASGQLGVATVTHGPGLTNAITSLHEAAAARTPLLVLAGDTATGAAFHEQDIDQKATVATTGAGFVPLRSPASSVEDLMLAVRQAWLERRPVIFNMPVDIQTADSPEDVDGDINLPIRGRPAPDTDELDRALGILAVANRPVLLAGQGAADTGSRDAIQSLAETLRAPLATTLLASGLFKGHPFDLGVHGTLSSALTIETLARGDCLVVFGASLNRYTTAHGALLSGKSVIQVDHDLHAFGRWSRVTQGVLGDASTTATMMAEALMSLATPPPGLASTELQLALTGRNRDDEFLDESTAATIDGRTLMARVHRALPTSRAVVTDVGGFLRTALRFLPTVWPEKVVVPGHYGSIGLGLACAIGSAFADQTRPVVVVVGDGGFMMGGLAEFDTAVRYGLDVVVVVMNNKGYDLERLALADRGGNPRLADMAWPAFADVARSLGGQAVAVQSLADLEAMDAAISARQGPLLIDARIAPTA